MPQPRQQQQYQRLNAFGEPFRGSKIRGVQARRYMGEPSQGALSDRRYNVREEAEKEAMRQDRAEMEQAAARGQAAAGAAKPAQQAAAGAAKPAQQAAAGAAKPAQQAAPKPSQPTAPKREGQLIPTVGGGSKWASGDELDRMDEMKAKARKRGRMRMFKTPTAPMTSAPSEHVA